MADDQNNATNNLQEDQQYDEIYGDINVDNISLVGLDTADYISTTLPDEDPEIQKILNEHTMKAQMARDTQTADELTTKQGPGNLDIGDISAYIAATKERHAQKQQQLKAGDGTDLTTLPDIYAIVPHTKGDHKLVYLEDNAPRGLTEDPKKRIKGSPYIKNGETIYDVKITLKKHPTLKNNKNEPLDVWLISTPSELQSQLVAIEHGKGGGTNFGNPMIINETQTTSDLIPKKEEAILPISEETTVSEHEITEPLIQSTKQLRTEDTHDTETTPINTPKGIDDQQHTIEAVTAQDKETEENNIEIADTDDPLSIPIQPDLIGQSSPTESPFSTWKYTPQEDQKTPLQNRSDSGTDTKEHPIPQPKEKTTKEENITDRINHAEGQTPYTEDVSDSSVSHINQDKKEYTNNTNQLSDNTTDGGDDESKSIEVIEIREPAGTRPGGFALNKELPKKPLQEESVHTELIAPKAGIFRGLDDKEETTKKSVSIPPSTHGVGEDTSPVDIHEGKENTPPTETPELTEMTNNTEEIKKNTEAQETNEQDTKTTLEEAKKHKEQDGNHHQEKKAEEDKSIESEITTINVSSIESPLPEHAELLPKDTEQQEIVTEDASHAVIDIDMIQADTTNNTKTKPVEIKKVPKKRTTTKVKPLYIILRIVLLIVVVSLSWVFIKIMWPSQGADPLETDNISLGEQDIENNQSDTNQGNNEKNNGDEQILADKKPIEEPTIEGTSSNSGSIEDPVAPQQFTLIELTKKIEAQEIEARKLNNKAKLIRNQEAIKFSLAAIIRAGNALEKIETDDTTTAEEMRAEAEAIDKYILAIENLLD